MEDALDKIRPHVKSALLNQSAPAKLLVAVETTLKEQGQEPTPVAYYASFLATLQESVKREEPGALNLEEGAVIPSTLYLLSLVFPHVPHAVVRANVPTILGTIAPLFPLVSTSAPPLRSILGVFAAIVAALDAPQFSGSTPLLRQSFATVLELTIDPRPKVRKRAQEVVADIINSPPPPLLVHPYANQAAEYIIGVLGAVAGNPGQQESTEIGIWTCSFVKTIAPSWPPVHLDALLQPVLSLPSLSSSYLTTQAYALLSALLRAPDLSLPAASILSTLLTYSPSHHTLAPPWLDALENTMVAYARADADACTAVLPKVWETTWVWLESPDVGCRRAAESALCAMVRYCITDAEIVKAAEVTQSTTLAADSTKKKGKKNRSEADKTVVGGVTSTLAISMHAVAFAKATPSLLSILTALVSRLRLRITPPSEGIRAVTAAEILLPELIVYVGGLRLAKQFEYREKADEVLGMAIRVLGPEVFLDLLPLNILPEAQGDKKAGPGRAFLLPLLATHITNTRLTHFTTVFVPLSEQLFDMKVKADEAEKVNESKVWEVLIAQIWACFKGYCDLAVDTKEAFTTPFARLVTNLLYTQPTLRTSILQGLRTLLTTNLTLASSSAPPESLSESFGISQEQAKENVKFLEGISGNMISVLFNVFSTVPTEERGLVGEVVKAWMGVLPSKEIKATYGKVTTMLSDALAKPTPSNPATKAPPVSHTMLDLLLILLPFLPPVPSAQLFDQALTSEWIENADPGVQKRSYRLLARCVESGTVKDSGNRGEFVEKVVKRIVETSEKVAQGAQRDRIQLLTDLVPLLLPSSQLHFIPSLLPEAILATKEVSEKARTAAFDLLVAMGTKMTEEGGVVKRDLVDGIAAMDLDSGSSTQVNASVEEYMTMVAAGLVGSTPHMISATITAISRLLFEFKDVLPTTMQSELLSTVIVFLTSSNREIVKSAIGFIKLSVITLPVSIVRPQFKELVPALLGWSHDHKNHFKTKVQHIFERMGRRFGWEAVLQNAGSENDEGLKVLENVKKRKEKAKKQKAKVAARDRDNEEDGSEDDAVPKATAGDAFEDVLYGSDSDADDGSDDEKDAGGPSKQKVGKNGRPIASPGRGKKGQQQQQQAQQGKNAAKNSETRIRADDDEPMDLLHAGAGNAVASNSRRRRQPGQEASKFKTDGGRIVIDDDTFKPAPSTSAPDDDVAGQAYREQMTGVDGFTRTPNGEIKFHKNTKKRRAEEAAADAVYGDGEGGDVEMGDGTAPASGAPERKKKHKQERVALGAEFKAKNAGGDVKRKGQQDPFAYLPLSSVGSKKKGGAGKVKYSITGKR